MHAMNMPLAKSELASVMPSAAPDAENGNVVVALQPKRPGFRAKIAAGIMAVLARVVPPIIVVTLMLIVWELLCRKAGSSLPPPSRVFSDTWELIADPFFDRGGIDKGL